MAQPPDFSPDSPLKASGAVTAFIWLCGASTELELTSWWEVVVMATERSDFQLLGINSDNQIGRGAESLAGPSSWV